LVIKKCKTDGNFGAEGYVVEAGFPLVNLRTRTFGRDGNNEALACLKCGNGVGNYIITRSSVNRNPTQPAHHWAAPTGKQGILAHPVHIKAVNKGDCQGQREVPVAGVGDGDHDVFQGCRWMALEFPAANGKTKLT